MRNKALSVAAALLLSGCGLRHYEFAKHGPGDTSAGDVTHVSDPGARVVVPSKRRAQQASQACDCGEICARDKSCLLAKCEGRQ